MSQPTSLATLLVASLLGQHPCVDVANKRRNNGPDGVDADEADQRAIRILRAALGALTVTFAVASSLPPPSLDLSLDDDCFDVSDELTQATSNSSLDLSECDSDTNQSQSESDDEEEVEELGLMYVDSNDVKTCWTQRARLARARKPRSVFQGHHTISQAQIENDTMPKSESLALHCTPEIAMTQPNETHLTTTSRRQRRRQEKTSNPYSDFDDDDLARQIEAMALGVEAAFENRHVQKPKQNATELVDSAFSIMEEVSEIKSTETVSSTPFENPPQVKTVEVVKDLSFSSSRYPLVLPRQMVQAPQKCNDMPGLISSDSLASLYSTDSISARSSTDFGRLSSMRKSRRMSLQRNAEWAIIE